MKKNIFMPKFLNILYFTILLLPFFSSIKAEEKPNVVIVIGDDVGWDAFGCTGFKNARTPNIDALARESCMMDRFYCSVSQCAPLRAELYTGLLPFNNGVLANAVKKSRPGVKNIADHLVPLGYKVGLTGKRHFGLGTEKIEAIPGFSANGNGSTSAFNFDGVREFIKTAKKADSPFCICICSTHAHHPWDQGKEENYPVDEIELRPHYIDTPDTRVAVAKHSAEVEELDRQLGATVELLTELKLSDDTLLIFLSEQGIAMPRGKWSPYEHGSRALCLARWPGKITPRKTGAIAMYCDIVPTLVDLAGGGDPGLDGKSLRKVWQDGADQHREAAFISNVHPFWQKAIVTADYKLIWSAQPETEHIWGNFTSKGKFFSRPWAEWRELAGTDKKAAEKLDRVLHPQKLELYKVDDDPYEMVNLASNPEYKSKLEELHTSLKALMAEVGEPLQPQELRKKDKKKKKSQP